MSSKLEKNKNMFSKTECLSEELMQQYIQNKLSQRGKYKVEKHLTDCEFCSDALEGLSMIKSNTQLSHIIDNLKYEIKKNLSWKNFLMRGPAKIAVAASIILIAGSIFFLVNYFKKDNSKTLVDQYKPNEVFVKQKNISSEASNIEEPVLTNILIDSINKENNFPAGKKSDQININNSFPSKEVYSKKNSENLREASPVISSSSDNLSASSESLSIEAPLNEKLEESDKDRTLSESISRKEINKKSKPVSGPSVQDLSSQDEIVMASDKQKDKETLQKYEEILKKDPNNEEAKWNKALILVKQGKTKAAKKILTELVSSKNYSLAAQKELSKLEKKD